MRGLGGGKFDILSTGGVFLKSNLTFAPLLRCLFYVKIAFVILLWMFVVKHKMRPTYKICFCRCGRIGVVELPYRSGLFDFYASFLKSKSSR